jgi:hypothetical protein
VTRQELLFFCTVPILILVKGTGSSPYLLFSKSEPLHQSNDERPIYMKPSKKSKNNTVVVLIFKIVYDKIAYKYTIFVNENI